MMQLLNLNSRNRTTIMLLIAGLKVRYVAVPGLVGLTALVTFIAHDPVRSERIYAWLHPEETRLEKGMQAWQSMAALGNAVGE